MSNAVAALLFRNRGAVPSLDLQFSSMSSLDSRITFSRADASTCATHTTSAGLVATVAANVARFDYDPGTLSNRGLLIEGAATNLQRHSETYSTTGSYWYINSNPGTAINNGAAASAPDGASTPKRLTEPSSGTSAGLLQISGSSAGIAGSSTVYTVSFWAKSGSRTRLLWNADAATKRVGFDLDAGTATVVSGTFISTGMVAYPSGWYRCHATWANTNASGYPGIYTATGTGSTYTISYACDSSYIELWGFQLETGYGPSSYIATTTAQKTRAADTAIMTGTNFSDWYTGGASGTFIASWRAHPNQGTTARTVIATNDQTEKHLHMYQVASAQTLRLADFGASTTITTANTMTDGELTFAGFSYAVDEATLVLDAGAAVTDVLGFTDTPSWLSFGGPSTNGTSITGSTVMLNGTIASLKYYPVVMTAPQLQAKTA